jgi:F-type H+-transporting ATPase subunit delta
MNEELIASRYSRALFDAAVEKGCVEELGDTLARIAGAVVFDRAAEAFWESPMVEHERKKAAIEKIIGKGGISPFAAAALRVLLEKERVGLLKYIAQGYNRLADVFLKRTNVVVSTRVPLSAEALEKLRRILEAKTGRTAKVQNELNPKMLGGIVVRIGNTVFDASVRGRLEQLRLKMMR